MLPGNLQATQNSQTPTLVQVTGTALGGANTPTIQHLQQSQPTPTIPTKTFSTSTQPSAAPVQITTTQTTLAQPIRNILQIPNHTKQIVTLPKSNQSPQIIILKNQNSSEQTVTKVISTFL